MNSTVDRLRSQYGERMTIKEVAEVIRVPYNTIMNKRVSGTFGMPTHRDGLRVWAFTEDVAKYFEGFKNES